jgi:hypothetical protein
MVESLKRILHHYISIAVSTIPVTATSSEFRTRLKATTAATGTFPFYSLGDLDAAAVEFFSIEVCYSLLGIIHLNESEPFGAAGFPIHYDFAGSNFTKLTEQFLQIFLSGAVRQITYEKFHKTLQKKLKRKETPFGEDIPV